MTISVPLYPWEQGIGDNIHLIGLVATRWTSIEILTQQLIAGMTDLHDPAMAAAMLTHVGDKTAMDIIRSLANAFVGMDPKVRALLVEFTNVQDTCRQNRNFLVHGLHATSEIDPNVHVVSKMTSRGRIRIAHYVLPVSAIITVMADIQKLNAFGRGLVEAFNAARSGQTVPTKVPKAPAPKLLTNILQTIQPKDYMRDPEIDRGWHTKSPPAEGSPVG